MSLQQKQYNEPPAIEVDPAKLHAHIKQLRHVLQVTINSYKANSKKGYPSELMQKMAADVLKATEGLYFPP